jgi:hypothetical protein
VTNIAGGEHSGAAGFQVVRFAIQRPFLPEPMVFSQIRAGHEITLFIAHQAGFRSPVSVGNAAEAKKKLACLDRLLLTAQIIDQSYGL